MNITAIVETFIVSLAKYYALTTMFVYIESKNVFEIHKIFGFQLALLQNYPKTVLRFAKKGWFFTHFKTNKKSRD